MAIHTLSQSEIQLIKQGAHGIAGVITRYHHFAQDQGGKLYNYDGGVFRPEGERCVNNHVKRLLEAANFEDKWSSHKQEEVLKCIQVDAPLLWDRPPLDRINVHNGLIQTATSQLLPHSPDALTTVQLPIDYDPGATCPRWEKFVSDTLPHDSQDAAWEIIAWLMVPVTSIQKALFLQGDGCNGKSVFLRALIRFLGKDNVSTLTLHKLEHDRFATARLIGKLANISPDLPNQRLQTTSTFKSITGGDRFTGEYKFQGSFDFRPFVRLVFSANQLPVSSDSSHGWYRRFIVVPFDRTFKEDPEMERQLDTALSDSSELSGVLNMALAALPQVLTRGIAITPNMQQALDDFRDTNDPVLRWLERETTDDVQGWLAKRALYGAYLDDMRADGRIPLAQKSFGSNLKRLRPQLQEAQRTHNGKRTWGWLGILFADNSIHSP